jgi:hypothetical protein
MGHRRKENLGLPDGVLRVRSKGRTYYYYRPGRGTARAAEPIKIFGDPFAPVGTTENERFWRELNHAVSQTVVYAPGSIKVLIDLYRDDDAFTSLWCRPKKTRRRRKSVFIPLRTAEALELDRWAETPSRLRTRIGRPRERSTTLMSTCTPCAEYPTQRPACGARWHRWLGSEAGLSVCAKWREWLAEQVTKYEWEIEPDDVKGPTIHGLRETGVLLRWSEGYDVDQISNDIGMSRQMVDHYMRFKDQMDVATHGRKRLRLVTRE